MIGTAWFALGGAVAGLIAGSFIATLVLRWPAGRGLGGRSHCEGCARVLGIRDLVPVASYLAVRGHCRACGSEIDRRHLHIEVACAFVGAIALGVAPGVAGMAGALFGWQLLALAALDFEHFWLPDRLTGLLGLTGLLAAWVTGDPLAARLIGGASGFASLFMIAWIYEWLRGRKGMGAGDPKLLGAIGLWLGWRALPFVLVAASAVGLLAVAVAALRGKRIAGNTQLPLGTLMAVAAFPVWMLGTQG